MLKNQIIAWINSDRDYHAGIYLLKHIYPTDPLINQPDTPERRTQLLLRLGKALKTGEIPTTVIPSEVGALGISIKPTEINEESKLISLPDTNSQIQQPTASHSGLRDTSNTGTLPGLSDTAALSMQIGDHRKSRAYYHNQLHSCKSDAERKKIVHLIDQLSDQIQYKKKLITQLESGELKEIPLPKEEKKLDLSVPDNMESLDLYFLDNKLRLYRATRSKRKAKMFELAAKGKHESPEYRQALAELQQVDQSIRVIDEHKKKRITQSKA